MGEDLRGRMSNKVVPVAVLTAAVVGIVALAKKTKVERRRNNTTLEVEDLSSRGEALLTPTLPYLLGFLRALQDHADVCVSVGDVIELKFMALSTLSRRIHPVGDGLGWRWRNVWIASHLDILHNLLPI